MQTRATGTQKYRLLGLLAFLTWACSATHAMEGWMPPAAHCESVHNTAPQPAPSGYAPEWPKLPEQYSLRVEANIYQKQYTSEVEEHYDYINQRASASYTFNGTTVWSFFDYKVGERYDVYPNGTCVTDVARFNLFGYTRRDKTNGRPVMATIGEVFNFGKRFNMTFVGRATVRGIPVDHWTSCKEYGQYASKFQLDWYFSTPDYQTASGHSQLPVRLMLKGRARNVGMMGENVPGNHTFEHMYEFVSIRAGPVVNEDVFQIPPGIVCKTQRSNNRPPPAMPDRFQMSMEVVVPNSPMHPRQQCLRYDYEHRLLETAHRMTVPLGWKMGKGRLVEKNDDEALDKLTTLSMSVVEDHKNGILYHMDKVNLTCKVTKLDLSADKLSMSHGANILFLDTEEAKRSDGLLFQGHTTIREMKVEVWSMEKDGVTQQVYFLPAKQARYGDQTIHPEAAQGGSDTVGQGGQHASHGSAAPGGSQWGSNSGQGSIPTGQHWGSSVGSSGQHSGGPSGSPWGQGSSHGSSGAPGSSPNPQSWAPSKPKTNMNMLPYPVIVGMYLRNRTHKAGPINMMRLFREVLPREAMQWTNAAEAMIDWDPSSASPPNEHHHKMRQMFTALNSSEQIAWGRRMERVLDSNVGDKQIHVYDYQPLHLDSTNFQVSFCYEPDQKSKVMLMITAEFNEDVLHYYAAFSNSLRNAIASATGLSVLQVSELVPMPMRNKQLNLDATQVTFTLLGKPPGQDIQQTTIEEAKKKLTDAVKKGITFNVEYADHSRSFIVDKNIFALDYDQYKMADLLKNAKPVSGQTAWNALLNSGNDDGDDTSGYSAGTLAGVALTTLVLGAAICFGVVFFLYKRRHPDQSFAPYKMT